MDKDSHSAKANKEIVKSNTIATHLGANNKTTRIGIIMANAVIILALIELSFTKTSLGIFKLFYTSS